MAPLGGLVSHHGRKGCHIYCNMPGHNKRGKPHYYPTHLKPNDHEGHTNIHANTITGGCIILYQANLQQIKNSCNKRQYEANQKETGICKPSIFSSILCALPVPTCFSLNIMYLPTLNIPDLLFRLWHVTLECNTDADSKTSWDWATLTGVTWKTHGKTVAAAAPYFPRSFDRMPQNPAKKLNSGYKAWEFLIYLYGLGPGLFYDVLPQLYWKHFCKLVKAIRIISQKSIKAKQLTQAHMLLNQYAEDFKLLYYQCRHCWLHFIHPAIHTLCHLAHEIVCIGPGICSVTS
jgi:hypothetical protein